MSQVVYSKIVQPVDHGCPEEAAVELSPFVPSHCAVGIMTRLVRPGDARGNSGTNLLWQQPLHPAFNDFF